jgi:hypothetical protein
MLRKCLFFCTILAIAYGCSKKKPTEPESSPPPPGVTPRGATSTPSPAIPSTVTIKIREDKVGDKTHVNEESTSTSTFSISYMQNKKSDVKSSSEKSDYIQAIYALKTGEQYPTKFTRDYKAAEFKEGDGPSKPASYVGKLVSFEKSFGHYSVTVNKNSIPSDEDEQFRTTLEKVDRTRRADLMPKGPVQVNVPWPINVVYAEDLGKLQDIDLNKAVSKGTGVLTSVYNKGGKQWGVLEFKLELCFEGGDFINKISGSFTQTISMELVVDGSANEGVEKKKQTGKYEVQTKNLSLSVVDNFESVETYTPVAPVKK